MTIARVRYSRPNPALRRMLDVAILMTAGVFALLVMWVTVREEDSASFSCTGESVIVQPGDTLDSIARANCTGDVNGAIRLLVDFYGTDIRPGQRIALPPDR